ncbi:ATP-binding protein [Ferruginibacter sp. SUN106]|uniref:ATP-binding protein n=1 Tax=Ferruginibacter sp. SUN106 TaxID=2978348 RepID=UPI003D362E11
MAEKTGPQDEALLLIRKELFLEKEEKNKLAAELVIVRNELAFQKVEKGKRAAELGIANKELEFQDGEKEKRATELDIANIELAFQDKEKEKRAAELGIANIELIFQSQEKEKRKIANAKIIESEISLRSLIENLPVAVYTCDENGFIEVYNKVAEKLWGRKPDTGKDQWCGTWKGFSTEGESIPLDCCPMAITIKEKRSIPAVEIIIERPDGTRSNVISNPQAIFDNNGNLTGAINTLLDITQERKLHDASKLLSKYSRSLIEASRDPLFTISPEGKITDANEASVNITGIAREQLTGTDFINYFTEPEKAKEGYLQVFEKGFVSDYPLTVTDHKLTDVLFNGSVYKDEEGHVIGAVVVARDITEQKVIENELIEAKIFAELATIIAEDAKSKAESSTKIAVDAVKAKQQFLSNMSHEIRTPMNAIIGFTKVVLKTDLTAKQKEYLTAIKMSGDALIVLINDILDLAKVDAGKMVFEATPFKMALSISAMLHLFETKIQEKNLELVKEYDHTIPEVLVGDPVRLHQIILNLVSNAVKFTSKGKIVVNIKMLSEDEHKVTIEFSVADTGIGISDNKIEKIFENFQQASSGTSRLYGGTGLGLAIVKQLVEAQGGTITVQSTPDEGSVFSFVLNFQKTTEIAEPEILLAQLNEEIKNIKVLVVEDIALNQLLMKTLLDDFGFERDIAANGKIAIEKLQSKDYDVILMDLQMPEMNGFEATEYIRNTMHSKIPIIALTADVTTVDLAKCKAVGMNDYIAKPVDERLLYSKIVGLVKKPPFVKVAAEEIENPSIKKIKCIDLDYLLHRTKSNPSLMMEMISLYLEQTPPLISAMKQGMQDKDWNTLYAAVHKMIPSFSIMGISADFEVMAKKVQEFASTQKQTEGITEMILQLENICIQSCRELEEELNTIKKTNS